MSGRLFFVAIDSGDNVLLEQWMDAGILPNLARIRDGAAVTIVRSPTEMGNGTMWQTVATGVNMGRHGLHYIRQLETGTYRLFDVDEDAVCKAPTVWQRISDAGHRCIVVDMFRSPLSKWINGVEINDWMASFRTLAPRSMPDDAVDAIVRDFGGDPFDGNADKWFLTHRDYRRMVDLFAERVEMKTRAVSHLMTSQPWDLLMAAYADVHDVSHLCWHLHDPAAPEYDGDLARQMGDPVERIYRGMDDAIGRLVSRLDPDDTIMVFAGLGFQNLYSVGNLFRSIVARLEGGGAPQRASQRSLLARKVGAFRPGFLRKMLPKPMQRRLGRSAFRMVDRVAVDARRNSRYFALECEGHAGAIRVNLAGREPAGKVAPDQFDAVIDEIERDFREIVNVETGKSLVLEVVRTRDAYAGPYLDDLPDLYVVWDRRAPIRTVWSPKIGSMQVDHTTARTGDHTPLSYLLLKGPGVAAGRQEAEARPEDVGATILALAGLDVTDLDGRPIPALRQGSSKVKAAFV